MVSMSALHSLTAELHAGFLTLAFVCIVIVVAAQITVRLRNRLPRRLVNLAIKTRGYAEAASFVGAVLGVIGLLLSAYTGMYAWPEDVLLESAVVRNKILLTAFATVLWAGVVFIRFRFGRGLWTCPAMAVVYVGTVFAAYGVLGMTGSLGAHLTVGESVLDPLWNLIGVQVSEPITLSLGHAALVAIASGAAFVLSLLVASRYNLFGVRLAPETCQKFFRWDEPRIVEPGQQEKRSG